ncbi:MAG: TlpA family protein disulfide reductase [Candidatus Eremiobacteraeota bacterium]|nr:TlpA family protein disulfide reductase [Candidatus Eremiobacteraeota bacterium]
MKRLYAFAAALFTTAALPISAFAAASVGKPAPSFTAPLASGGKLTLSSLHGKPVYLNFFATWCAPCNAEAPDINALQKQYQRRGFVTIGVDEREDADKAKSFVHKFGLSYKAVVDENGDVLNPYGAIGLPVHVFIDRRGNVKLIRNGEMSKAEIEAAIKSIL